ncbi:SRPBCC family protein [Pseudomonas sp. LS44]|uniref:SRPBCC family protein n=1 Tax=Pseudomonas sp. LS44 TaxID=1357074 RepID=UPI00215B60AC|nr:SRPBCC family protein [Pseudomonas sp. LS44]UVE16486.1 SRPBCC family protein [Pseudomonas sp. LS44]
MSQPLPSQTLSVHIQRELDTVYRFLAQPANFPLWASGLGDGLQSIDGEWFADTANGRVRIRFSEANAFGVLDHYVYPAPGIEIYVPLRVLANGDGCDVVFTLFRQPDMDDASFAADADWVMRDLDAMKQLLETPDQEPR